jgi:competence transcription factor ComK
MDRDMNSFSETMNRKSWEALKENKRREAVKKMKENGITYEQADEAFLDMMGEMEEEEEK